MKSFLLSGIVSLAFFSSFSQSQPTKNSRSLEEQGSFGTQNARTQAMPSYSWNPFTSSMNCYNSLVSNSKQLQYNEDLNVVTFVHRKSPHYVVSPSPASNAQSNAIVAMVSANWGTSWDSTCIWSNDVNRAIYPQGGVYNPPSNTSLSNAFVIGTGICASTGFSGNWFASKAIGAGNYNNTPSAIPNAQQFIANTPPYGPMNKVDFARYDFTTPDDGAVRVLGTIMDDINSAPGSFRGAASIKGAFTSGVFSWSSDSVIPSVMYYVSGKRMMYDNPHMAWNEDGTVGYIWFIGVQNGATGSNRGYQPIVYKTTNSGVSWTMLSPIDFNLPTFASVLNHLEPVNTSSVVIPHFSQAEGIDGIVDKNDRLHIVSTLVSTVSDYPDSLHLVRSFLNPDGQLYPHKHLPGKRPYIYDFTETPTGWKVTVVDSMLTESPGSYPTDNGYSSNPWATYVPSGEKLPLAARIQLSRSSNGEYIVYTWAESNPLTTAGNYKWNERPDIKARLMNVTTGSIHPTEINITNSAATVVNTLVAMRATQHYVSPKCAVLSSTAGVGVSIQLPVTVSNSYATPMDPNGKCIHWYTSAVLDFVPAAPVNTTSINENVVASEGIRLYPNPAGEKVNIVVSSNAKEKGTLRIIDITGKTLTNIEMSFDQGENNLSLNVNDLSRGLYFVCVSFEDLTYNTKLIIR